MREFCQSASMIFFKDAKEVEEWLEPLEYEDFWRETGIFNLAIPSREHCDECILKENVPMATILSVVKGMARLQIVNEQKLPSGVTVPWMSLH